mmetsp:Transcript_14228/g.22666  ORF Transcript_14228/g.22666 Transcript_14228/m.22666 type:complete len:93 (-) Transcript_14228:1992-2270(-)
MGEAKDTKRETSLKDSVIVWTLISWLNTQSIPKKSPILHTCEEKADPAWQEGPRLCHDGAMLANLARRFLALQSHYWFFNMRSIEWKRSSRR